MRGKSMTKRGNHGVPVLPATNERKIYTVSWICTSFNSDSDPGFCRLKIVKIYSRQKIQIFRSKLIFSFIPRPPGRTSKLRSNLQPSKDNIKHLKKHETSSLYFIFALLDPIPDPDQADQNQCGSMWIGIRIHSTWITVPLNGRHTYERQVGLLLIVNRVQDLLPYRAETEKNHLS